MHSRSKVVLYACKVCMYVFVRSIYPYTSSHPLVHVE